MALLSAYAGRLGDRRRSACGCARGLAGLQPVFLHRHGRRSLRFFHSVMKFHCVALRWRGVARPGTRLWRRYYPADGRAGTGDDCCRGPSETWPR